MFTEVIAERGCRPKVFPQARFMGYIMGSGWKGVVSAGSLKRFLSI